MHKPPNTGAQLKGALKEGAAAAYSSISPRQLAKLRYEGRIGFVRIGKKAILYPIAELDRFLRENTQIEVKKAKCGAALSEQEGVPKL